MSPRYLTGKTLSDRTLCVPAREAQGEGIESEHYRTVRSKETALVAKVIHKNQGAVPHATKILFGALAGQIILLLAACSTNAPILTSQNRFPPGEYVTTKRTVAAIDADSFRLAIVALNDHDAAALRTMTSDGRVFDLPAWTRVALVSENNSASSVVANIDGTDLCAAEIESGLYIGSRVVIPCESVALAK